MFNDVTDILVNRGPFEPTKWHLRYEAVCVGVQTAQVGNEITCDPLHVGLGIGPVEEVVRYSKAGHESVPRAYTRPVSAARSESNGVLDADLDTAIKDAVKLFEAGHSVAEVRRARTAGPAGTRK